MTNTGVISYEYNISCNNSTLDAVSHYTIPSTSGHQIEYNCLVHPDSVLSIETFTKIDKTIQCGLIPSFFLIGAPTNIVSMIVFFRQGLRDRMNLCLFCLAFTDLMYVTAVLIDVSYCFIGIALPSQVMFLRYTLITNVLICIYGFSYFSGCLTMIIAVERCVCVMFPMKAATLISTKAMAKVLALTFLLTQGLCVVYSVKARVTYVTDPVSGEKNYYASMTELYRSNILFHIIEDVVLSVISFLCFTVVLTATTITVVQLRQAMSWRKSTASGSSYLKGQAVLMRMLVAVSSVYILCTAPNVALALTRFSVPEFRADGAQCSVFLVTHMMAWLITMLNSSINFFVYITMSSRFRQEMKTCFLCSAGGNETKGSATKA